MKISGLYNLIDIIHVVILGNDNNYKILKLDEKIECVYKSGETYLYQRPILNHMMIVYCIYTQKVLDSMVIIKELKIG
jgi:hypothetical protein